MVTRAPSSRLQIREAQAQAFVDLARAISSSLAGGGGSFDGMAPSRTSTFEDKLQDGVPSGGDKLAPVRVRRKKTERPSTFATSLTRGSGVFGSGSNLAAAAARATAATEFGTAAEANGSARTMSGKAVGSGGEAVREGPVCGGAPSGEPPPPTGPPASDVATPVAAPGAAALLDPSNLSA